MQKQKRPSARFRPRRNDLQATRETEAAAALAGKRDADELVEMDTAEAWLEHVDNGGENSQRLREIFVAAYEAAYERVFAGEHQEQDSEVPSAI